MFLYVHVCINFKTIYLKNEKTFLNQIFRESLYIHVLLAQRIKALQLYRSKNAVKLGRRLHKNTQKQSKSTSSFFVHNRTKSKRFAFVSIISESNHNVLFRSISFWIIQKRSILPKTISRPNQIALLHTRIFGQKRKRFACDKNIFGPNQNVLLLFR